MTSPAAPPATTAAAAFIEALVEVGIEYLFANLGTDHVSIIEELARREEIGLASPRVILCPHENVAAHMAGGYALATGRGQAVLVHVDAGTANAAMAMHNLFRSRIPVLLIAGRAPYSFHGTLAGGRDNYVHFVQDPFDIASLVRSYCKWEYDLPSGLLGRASVHRAHSVMHSDPMGPVFLTFARETLAAEISADQLAAEPTPRGGAVKAGGVDTALAEQIADALMAADKPIAITGYLGRTPQAADVLNALARACAIQVCEFNPTDANIRRDSPCLFTGSPEEAMADADLGLLLDIDVPFLPKAAPFASRMRWLQIDVDPLKSDFPMWGFDSDLRIQASCALALRQVLDLVRAKSDATFQARIDARMKALEAAAATRRERLNSPAASRDALAMSADDVCAAVASRLSSEDLVVNEAVTNAGTALNRLSQGRPGTYFANGGGGLGHSGGVALGLKLAHPDRRVVQVVGDGVFHFINADSVYAVAHRYGLPILTVVLDNAGWKAVKSAVQRVYPNGAAGRADSFQSRLVDAPSDGARHFAKLCQAFGGDGEEVFESDQLQGALDRCLAALDRGQAAVLHVHIAPH